MTQVTPLAANDKMQSKPRNTPTSGIFEDFTVTARPPADTEYLYRRALSGKQR